MIDWEEVKKQMETRYCDYTIVSKPTKIFFECPICDKEVELDFDERFWESGEIVKCPYCENNICLGDWEYD